VQKGRRLATVAGGRVGAAFVCGRDRGRGRPQNGADDADAEREAGGLAGGRPAHEQLAQHGDGQTERRGHEEQNADGLHGVGGEAWGS
jgi:hypothetical protein